jgi:hypothetical protein
MKVLSCEICRKKMDDPVSGRTYFHITNHDVCEECHDDVEAAIKPQIRAHVPFAYDWYEHLYIDTVNKACQKGRV